MKAKTRNLKSTAAFSVMVFGLTGVFLLSGFVEKNRPAPPAGLEDEDSALQGARLKGFSPGFESLTADWYWARALPVMKSAGGDRQIARAIYEQIFAASIGKQFKENAALHLLELDSRDERNAIRQVLQSSKAENSRCANNWHELLPFLQTGNRPAAKISASTRQTI